MVLPSRIDVITKDGRYGVVTDCQPKERILLVHWGSIERRVGREFEEVRYEDWVGCLELKEVMGWDARGSAVTRLSTVTKRRPKTRPTG